MTEVADVPASVIAAIHGMTARHWTRLAAAGRIPGAWQSAGPRGKWLFDPIRFAAWKAEQSKEVAPWLASTKGAALGGRVGSAVAENSGKAFKQQIDGWLKDAIGNGSDGSTQSHGATAHGTPSGKRRNASLVSIVRR